MWQISVSVVILFYSYNSLIPFILPMLRWFYHNCLDDEIVFLSEQERRHVFNVNRLRPGDRLILADGKGCIVEGKINNDESVSVISKKHEDSPGHKIHLFIATPRKNQMDQVLTQSAELGIASIHPMITERSVVIPDKDSTPDKWITRLKEACKQAHNPFFPEIHNPKSFKEAVDYQAKRSFVSLFGSTDGEGKTLTDIKCGSDVAWFVGPEGGFSGNEVDIMLASGFCPITIGRYTMRVETACIVGIAAIQLIVARVLRS